MKIQLRLIHVVLIVIALTTSIWAYLSFRMAKYQREQDRLNTELFEANKDIKEYEITVNNLAEYASEVEVQLVSKERALKKLSEEHERVRQLNIKNVNTIGKLRLRVQVLMDSVPPSDTIIIKQDCEGESGSYIKLPLEYPYKDRWVSMNTSVGVNGYASQSFNIDSLPLNITLGGKKESLFSKQRQVGVVTTPNPYINVQDMSFIQVEDKRKTPAHYLMVGTGVGIAITLLTGLML